MRVVLRAGFDRFTGYGNDAVDLAVNLAKQDIDVLPWPTSLLPGLPRTFTKLLEKNPAGPREVLLSFGPPDFIRPWEFARMAPVSVGYSMWERDPLTRDDLPWGRRSRKWSSHGLSGMAVTCPMNLHAFGAIDPALPMTVVPGGIEPEDWPVERRHPGVLAPMKFLMIGQLAGRKNPFALLETWQRLKATRPDFDATLHVHSTSPGLHPGIADGAYGPGITMTQRPMSREDLIALYLSCDVLVTTSRGEGNNKPAMEFMATGGTVIASDWGGHQNWLTSEAAYPVAGHMVPAVGRPEAVEFEIDRDDLEAQILAAWEHPNDAAKRGEYASRWIRTTCSWDVVVPRLVTFLARCSA